MPTPTADKLVWTFISAAPAGGLPASTVAAGSTVSNLVFAAALTNPVGAYGWFDGDTATVALRGKRFRIRGVEGAGYRLARDLADPPQAGDVARVVCPGSNRSTTACPQLTVGGISPEISPVAATTITGLTILQAAGQLGPGTLSMAFTAATKTVKIKMGTDDYGAELDLDTATSPAYVYDTAGGFLKVSWVAGSLPAANQTETWTLAVASAAVIPSAEGYEVASGAGGTVQYFPLSGQNLDGFDTMGTLTVYPARPAGTPTTIAAGGSLSLAAGNLVLSAAPDWPASGWVRNKTKGDCRYYSALTGETTLACVAANMAILVGGTAATPAIGAVLTGSVSGATGTVVAARAGYVILKQVNGTFQPGTDSVATIGLVSSAVHGFRGFEAVDWEAGDEVEPMSPVDIAQDLGDIEAWAAQDHVPANLVFSCPTEAAPLAMDNLGPNATVGVWLCRWLVDGMTAAELVRADLVSAWL